MRFITCTDFCAGIFEGESDVDKDAKMKRICPPARYLAVEPMQYVLLIHNIYITARTSFPAMAPFHLNQVVKGLKGSYQIIKTLKPNVFQAKIEDTSALSALSLLCLAHLLTKCSVSIKSPPSHNNVMFETESDTYEFDCIRNCLFIRSLRERIQDGENQCLVLEWMDNTLWDTKDESVQAKTRIFKTVARSCLNGLKAFSDMDGQGVSVHAGRYESEIRAREPEPLTLFYYFTDLNPNNILITGFSSATPVVKVADLGCCM